MATARFGDDCGDRGELGVAQVNSGAPAVLGIDGGDAMVEERGQEDVKAMRKGEAKQMTEGGAAGKLTSVGNNNERLRLHRDPNGKHGRFGAEIRVCFKGFRERIMRAFIGNMEGQLFQLLLISTVILLFVTCPDFLIIQIK